MPMPWDPPPDPRYPPVPSPDYKALRNPAAIRALLWVICLCAVGASIGFGYFYGAAGFIGGFVTGAGLGLVPGGIAYFIVGAVTSD